MTSPESSSSRLPENEALEEASLVKTAAEEVRKERQNEAYQEHGTRVEALRNAPEKMRENFTAEDYDKALELVEEIKADAESEPVAQRVLYRVGRLMVQMADFGLDALSGFDRSWGSHPSKGGLRSGHYEGYETPEALERAMEWLTDAQQRLADLKSRAERAAE